ncbi:MAG: response regulator transcription factor [Labedaea sp.]
MTGRSGAETGEAATMDHWTETSWRGGAGPPVLRAVAGRSVRILRRADPEDPFDPDRLIGTHPAPPVEDLEPGAVRVLVVSDDMLARRGMLAALDDQAGLLVIGGRRPGPGLADAIRSGSPDVLLLHGLSAEEAAPMVAEAGTADPAPRVLAVGGRGAPATSAGELSGQLPASASPEQVAAAVRLAAAGYAMRQLTGSAGRPADARSTALAGGLTGRECDVLILIARGMSNGEIARELTVSEHTVKSHVQNLLGKLKLRNRIHAVIYAFDTGLARPVSKA